MIINGYTILIVLSLIVLYYYIGYQHGKSTMIDKIDKLTEDLRERNKKAQEEK